MMGIVGWLMFGDTVRDEVTSNILLSDEYPPLLSLVIVAFIAIIPLTKVPLRYVLSNLHCTAKTKR